MADPARAFHPQSRNEIRHRRATLCPLWLAVHETSHGVAHLVLAEGMADPDTYVLHLSVEREEGELGHVRVKERQGRDPRPDVIRLLAGYVGENRVRYGRDWRPAATEFARFENLDDIRLASDAVRAIEGGDPAAGLMRAWGEAWDLLDTEWPNVLRLARLLRVKRYLSGAEFEAAWRAGR